MAVLSGRARLPIVIVGAGPVGLAAAARLVVERRDFVVVEAGPRVGHAVLEWGHVRLFTPWRYLVDDAARGLLESSGWVMPTADEVPTGRDLVVRYMEPLARLPEIANRLVLDTRVNTISRAGLDKLRTGGRQNAPFEIRIEGSERRRIRASAVIDASGTWASPGPLGTGGLPAIGELANADRLFYGIPDVQGEHRARFMGKRVGVVGSGHSAFNTVLDLVAMEGDARPAVTWLVRTEDTVRLWGGGAADQLAGRGALGQRVRRLVEDGAVQMVTGFSTDEVKATPAGLALVATDGRTSEPLDEVVVVTGFRPDLSLTRELRLGLDPVVEAPSALAPLIDPNVHSCGTVPPHGYRELGHPESDYYAVGMKSYGRAPTFLLPTGYEQVRSVVKALAGDLEAAGRTELRLPESGVCSTDFALAGTAVAVGGCCD